MRSEILMNGSCARGQPRRAAAIALTLLALPIAAVAQREPAGGAVDGPSAGGITTQTLSVLADRPPHVLVQVVEAETGRPIPGVQVFLAGTAVGGVTDEAGRVGLFAPEGGEWRIRLRQIGRAEESVEVSLGRSTITQVLATLRIQRVPEDGARLLPPLPGASRGAPADTTAAR